MHGVGEHIHGLHSCNLVILAQNGQVTGLRSRVTTYIYHTLGSGGNPLQCSCLENPRDGGAWWAAVYGVAQSLGHD